MAVIRKLQEAGRQAGPDRTQVDAEWALVRTPNAMLVKISTFGSDGRASKRKPSQVISIDRKIAAQLVTILESTFGSL